MSSVSCCTICNSISLFPSRPIPHHPTSSHLSHHSYIFISLGFRKQVFRRPLIYRKTIYIRFKIQVETVSTFAGCLSWIHIDKQNFLFKTILNQKQRSSENRKQVFRRPHTFPLNPTVTPTIVPTKPVSTTTAFSGFSNRG